MSDQYAWDFEEKLKASKGANNGDDDVRDLLHKAKDEDAWVWQMKVKDETTMNLLLEAKERLTLENKLMRKMERKKLVEKNARAAELAYFQKHNKQMTSKNYPSSSKPPPSPATTTKFPKYKPPPPTPMPVSRSPSPQPDTRSR